MFNLSRYFSLVSFILIVLAAGMLGPLYQRISLNQMQDLAEGRNVALAQTLKNAYASQLESLIAGSVGRESPQQADVAMSDSLYQSVVALLRETAVIEVDAYNRLGYALFSTNRTASAGENYRDHPAFRSAMNGSVSSELAYYPKIHAIHGPLSDVHVLSSYVPIAGKDGSIEGVLAVHLNVTPFIASLDRNLWWVTAGIFMVFAALYLMQYLVVRRAHGILQEQEGRIKAARDTLEIQVAARTGELKRANTKLEGEIVERRQAESKLNYLAYHDPLTGLANRRCFIERLDESLLEADRQGRRLAVLFVDLDQFKQINDSMGHTVGDELLISVAARLAEYGRLIDMLARLGGDEFICLMENVRNDDEVSLVAREILSAFDHPFRLGDHELFLSGSVGISQFPMHGNTVVELMRNADTAMYRAKGRGRGNYQFYTPEMTQQAQERIRMENLLRRALGNGELSVFLQPQVDARTTRLVGAEALVRWNSAELGDVLPVRFIPLAEESGLIVGLGTWVLRETCRQVMQWRSSGFDLPMVSVNVSVKQLERPEFIDTLAGILHETGMSPKNLKLELTESVVMAVGDAFALLENLRELGISLALDDFGTGYSSLSYLKALPIQQLKIDKSFVEGIGRNAGDEAIIRTILELSRSLGFEVVAEGVATQAQAAFLADLGCHQLQGHLHGRAISAVEFRARWASTQ